MKTQSKELVGGVSLLVISGVFLSQSVSLPIGTLRHIGPGMLPLAYAVILGLGGLGLIAVPLFHGRGEDVEPFSLRGPVCIFGAMIVFALLIRSAGLLVAAPCTMFLASLAGQRKSLVETLAFAIAITGACALLFRFGLGLPMPLLAGIG